MHKERSDGTGYRSVSRKRENDVLGSSNDSFDAPSMWPPQVGNYGSCGGGGVRPFVWWPRPGAAAGSAFDCMHRIAAPAVKYLHSRKDFLLGLPIAV